MIKKIEAAFALCIGTLAALYLFLSRNIDPGSMLEPGPGFIPRVLGVAALLIALVVAWQAVRTPGRHHEDVPTGAGLGRLAGFIVAIGVFIPLFECAGTGSAIFLLVLVLAKLLGSRGWVQPMLLAAITAAISYVLFLLLLDVPLPKGILF